MNHQEAAGLEAVEKYLLGELSASERDEFEEHFFSCAQCAEDVRAGAIFAANARAVFAEEARSEAGRKAHSAGRPAALLSWMRPAFAIPLLAAMLLLAVAAYQNLVLIPGLKRDLARMSAPQPYPAFFLRAVSRGDDQVIGISRSSPFLGLALDIPPGRAFPSYRCDIEDESGRTPFSIVAPAPPSPGVSLNLLIPGALPAGRYTLLLHGKGDDSSATELSRFSFIIQPK